jgi:hypothetical protein
MPDYRATLKRVGIAIAAFGLADIGFMIYSVSEGQRYSSSFNIFAVIAGVLLIRGSLKTARVVMWFSAFMLTTFAGGLFLIFPFLQPIGLLAVQAKLNPAWSVTLWTMAALVVVLLGWSYRQLRSPPVLEALSASGRSAAAPKIAIGVGFALVAFLAIMLNMTINGASGSKAIALARAQAGPGYDYAVQSVHWSGNGGRAVVAAYTDREIKHISVEWSE